MKNLMHRSFRRMIAVGFATILLGAVLVGCGGGERQDPFVPPSGLVGNIGSSE